MSCYMAQFVIYNGTLPNKHLDVRMANICFNTNKTAMLIDLDRRMRTDVKCTGLSNAYAQSFMYIQSETC